MLDLTNSGPDFMNTIITRDEYYVLFLHLHLEYLFQIAAQLDREISNTTDVSSFQHVK